MTQKLLEKRLQPDKYDYIIDCTGLHRSLLPKSGHAFLIPAYEYLLENVRGVVTIFMSLVTKVQKDIFGIFP